MNGFSCLNNYNPFLSLIPAQLLLTPLLIRFETCTRKPSSASEMQAATKWQVSRFPCRDHWRRLSASLLYPGVDETCCLRIGRIKKTISYRGTVTKPKQWAEWAALNHSYMPGMCPIYPPAPQVGSKPSPVRSKMEH